MTENSVRIELADPQGQLLEEIANPAMKRRDVAMTYRLAFAVYDRGHARVDWAAVNRAIIARWSVSGLDWIKREAFRAPGGRDQ